MATEYTSEWLEQLYHNLEQLYSDVNGGMGFENWHAQIETYMPTETM